MNLFILILYIMAVYTKSHLGKPLPLTILLYHNTGWMGLTCKWCISHQLIKLAWRLNKKYDLPKISFKSPRRQLHQLLSVDTLEATRRMWSISSLTLSPVMPVSGNRVCVTRSGRHKIFKHIHQLPYSIGVSNMESFKIGGLDDDTNQYKSCHKWRSNGSERHVSCKWNINIWKWQNCANDVYINTIMTMFPNDMHCAFILVLRTLIRAPLSYISKN